MQVENEKLHKPVKPLYLIYNKQHLMKPETYKKFKQKIQKLGFEEDSKFLFTNGEFDIMVRDKHDDCFVNATSLEFDNIQTDTLLESAFITITPDCEDTMQVLKKVIEYITRLKKLDDEITFTVDQFTAFDEIDILKGRVYKSQ